MATASEAGARATLLAALAAQPPRIESATGHRCVGGTHSRVHDGRIVCWSPDLAATVAIDAEAIGAPVPPALAARFGRSGADFWVAWTHTEVLAKLRDVPILTWLGARGLVSDGLDPDASARDIAGEVVQVRADRADLWLAVGMLVAAPPAPPRDLEWAGPCAPA